MPSENVRITKTTEGDCLREAMGHIEKAVEYVEGALVENPDRRALEDFIRKLYGINSGFRFIIDHNDL